MQITILKSKIHRATVSEARLDYVGSISIDEELLKASGMLEYEKVQVVNVNNGARFETYTIATKEKGAICLNGAAARQVQVGDKIIIMAYANLEKKELKEHKPKVVFVDDENAITKISHYETHGELF